MHHFVGDTIEKDCWLVNSAEVPAHLWTDGVFLRLIHFSIWFWLDHDLSITEMLKDVVKRPFITMGFSAFVLLIPLALTSNRWAVQQLKRSWAKLHRLVYVISVLVILHYFWHKSGKNDFETVSIYAFVIGSLLLYRLKK